MSKAWHFGWHSVVVVAARRGDVEIVTLLLEAGADPYIENEMGLNSFEISDKYGPFPSVKRALRNYSNKDK